ncbi:hypothetical protein ACP6PL_03340 [Dapis sp. BLCC M126]
MTALNVACHIDRDLNANINLRHSVGLTISAVADMKMPVDE